MNQGKRLLVYLLLNIAISAGTTLAVLWFWSQSHPTLVLPPGVTLSSAEEISPTPTVQAILPCSKDASSLTNPLPVNQVFITIDNIFGVGSPANEVVVIKSQSSESLNLTGWCLIDEAGSTFVFPALTLNQGSQVQVHTTTGVNTVNDLYWSRDTAVWQVGADAILLDSQGIERARYPIP